MKRSISRNLTGSIVTLGDRVFGQKMVKRLRFLEEAQWWRPERLQEAQHQLLNTVLTTAYQDVPFYEQLFRSRNLTPSDISTAADLRQLPIVTKDMLRAGYPDLVSRSTGRRVFEECTSGSTGQPFCVRKDNDVAGWYRASFLLALSWARWKMGDPHLQFGITPKRSRGRWLKDLVLRCRYVSAYDLSDRELDRHLKEIDRHSLPFVFGYPGALYLLAKRAIELGWSRGTIQGVTWGDTLFGYQRRTIEHAFGTDVIDTYGCGEGFQVSAQCGHSGIYHIHDLDVIIEYLDDQDEPAADRRGNIVVTRLLAGPMPFIRYRVGDVGAGGPAFECECGRGFSTMESIVGREADMIVTPSGNRLIVHFFTGVLEHFPQIHTFQVTQDEVDSIVLRVVPGKGFCSAVAEEARRGLAERGADLRIDVEVVDDIPLTPGGKRRFVISELPSDARP